MPIMTRFSLHKTAFILSSALLLTAAGAAAAAAADANDTANGKDAPPDTIIADGTIIAEVTDETQAAAGADIVPIIVDPVYRMTVPVNIDGDGPYNFLIDTGSERTVISSALAGKLDLEFVERALLQSIAGNRIVDTAYIPDLALGKQNYGGLIAPLLEAEDIGAEGIVGLDGLQGQRILFDFRVNEIAIEDVAEVSNAGYEIIVTGRRRSGQLILTNATISGVSVTVVIDTGAQTSIGNRALQSKLRSRKAKGLSEPTELTAVTGQKISADLGIAPDFRIGRARFSQIGIAFADSPTFKSLGLDKKPALFLGMSALRKFDRVAIDFKKRRVLFDVPNNASRPPPTTLRRF